MTDRPFHPRALGEIAIRCRDYAAMRDFYGRILGLTPITGGVRGGHRDGITFYQLGESHAGHVAVLALFADEGPVTTGAGSALHHLALALPWDEQVAARDWLLAAGHPAEFTDFDWAGWRGLFTRDPDGNTVELVAASPDWHITAD
ncbi:Glyoxalase/Bleomycin resistance protein/Dioxygenase superfamily protein [Loktanella sp. DSM 29012]|uniref:VOC family protein n=1 Tax=Loktanella sp. DSM 29012 TaxID=1881056 RepID=UPI0008C9C7FC|nr:VOC family protein [Loktanella sp. DSM 29012]SEQ45472.1 Glyoxalase/Bleomycin resistance protein/Dioxygenase superfamily protein [Loktanella sp. DSM 29012]